MDNSINNNNKIVHLKLNIGKSISVGHFLSCLDVYCTYWIGKSSIIHLFKALESVTHSAGQETLNSKDRRKNRRARVQNQT